MLGDGTHSLSQPSVALPRSPSLCGVLSPGVLRGPRRSPGGLSCVNSALGPHLRRGVVTGPPRWVVSLPDSTFEEELCEGPGANWATSYVRSRGLEPAGRCGEGDQMASRLSTGGRWWRGGSHSAHGVGARLTVFI